MESNYQILFMLSSINLILEISLKNFHACFTHESTIENRNKRKIVRRFILNSCLLKPDWRTGFFFRVYIYYLQGKRVQSRRTCRLARLACFGSSGCWGLRTETDSTLFSCLSRTLLTPAHTYAHTKFHALTCCYYLMLDYFIIKFVPISIRFVRLCLLSITK